MVAMTGTNYFALKNVASGKYINPLGNSITAGTLLTMLSSTDITQNKSAYWEPVAAIDPTLGVFDMTVQPLTGNAPLTVTMTGAKLTKENKAAYYRWSVFQDNYTLFSTNYKEQFTYTTPGTYRIQVRGRDYISRNTTKEYTITVNEPTGVDKTLLKSVSVFPNPLQDELNISGLAIGEKVVIYNIQGKKMLQQAFEGKSIRVGMLPRGFYLLKTTGYAPVKLLKQ